MAFWIFMTACDLLAPVLMILVGRWSHRHPGEPNWAVGYRTTRSMKNADTWVFAQTHCGKLWERVGLGMLLPSLGVMVLCLGRDAGTVSKVAVVLMTVQMAVLIGSIFPTELALKRHFDENGNRK